MNAASFMQKPDENAASALWLADAAALEKEPAPQWMQALRATGAEAFSETGLPTAAWEGWQYTNLRAIAGKRFHYTTEAVKFDAKKLPQKLLAESHRLVLVNGQFQPHLSDLAEEGIVVASLMDAAEKDMPGLAHHLVSVGDLRKAPFKALSSAYLRDGFVLITQDGVELEKPVEILFYNIGDAANPPAFYPRMLYWLGENSGLTLIERHMGEGEYLSNLYTAAALEPSARLKLYKFEEESLEAAHFSSITVQQEKSSRFEGFSCAIGGKITRQEHQSLLIDSGISSNIGGTYLIKDRQCHDFTVLADHFEPNGTSVQHFKGVINDQARAVFQGKIHVRRSAQKTDGSQSHHALLLSKDAEASFKPELEIYADDVKCSHGATSGQLDEAALFYMQSRGIPKEEARGLLIQSFLNEALAQVSSTPVREVYEERIATWLKR